MGASEKIFQLAKGLRREMTNAEKILWQALRSRKLKNFKFRRQRPIDRFIADFYCHQAKLIIEVDGGIHTLVHVLERDQSRTYELDQMGIKVLRFTNEQVINELNTVITEIEMYLSDDKGKVHGSGIL